MSQSDSTRGRFRESLHRLRGAQVVAFEAHGYLHGSEVSVATGEADASGFEAVMKLLGDLDQLAEAVQSSTYDVEGRDGRLRYRVVSADGSHGPWEVVKEDHLGGLGFSAFYAGGGNDFTTILDGLPEDGLPDVDGSRVEVEADLATVCHALRGIDFQTETGTSAIPVGSTVPVEVVVGDNGSLQLQLNGLATAVALHEQGIPEFASLHDWFEPVNINVDFSERL